jgi:hypothetical protein
MYKQKENAEKLLEKFAKISLLDGRDYAFSAYALKCKDTLYSGPKGISYQPPFLSGKIYFVAEVAIKLSPRGGLSLYQHFFQLDLAQIKAELEKIAVIDSDSILLTTNGIVNLISGFYYEIADFLLDYNGDGDNYPEIAKMLYKYRGFVAGKRYGL